MKEARSGVESPWSGGRFGTGLIAQTLADSLFRGRRKLLGNCISQFLRMFVSRVAQKTDLLSITPAPLAKDQMKAQAEPFHTRELVVKGLRLQTDSFLAIRGNGGEPSDEGFQEAFRLLHYVSMSTKYGQTLHRKSHRGQAT